jgi:hypothetical protein
MGPYAVVDTNLTLRLLSPLQHIYHGQPYARIDLNPMPESTLSSSEGLRIWTIGGLSTTTIATPYSLSLVRRQPIETTDNFKALLSFFSCFMTPANPRNECKTHYLARNGCANPQHTSDIYVLQSSLIHGRGYRSLHTPVPALTSHSHILCDCSPSTCCPVHP